MYIEYVQSNPESPHYVGAVVEYHPTTINGNVEAAAFGNALNYVTIIKKAKELNSVSLLCIKKILKF